MYDYLRHRVILGRDRQQYHMHNVDHGKWIPIDFVPQHLTLDMKVQKGEARINLALLAGIDTVEDAPAPGLNEFIESEQIERTDPGGESERVDREDKAQTKTAALLDNRPRSHLALGEGCVNGTPWPWYKPVKPLGL
jgi:hypothetical protein